MNVALIEAIEMGRQLQDKLAALPRTRYTALAATALEEFLHWLKDESETDSWRKTEL